MLGQKENPVRANKLRLHGDLSDRKLNLAITLQNSRSWAAQSDAFLETTNFPRKNQPSPLPTTPSTGRTFGVAVAMQPAFHPRSPSLEREQLTRRLRRYSQAETALRESTAGLSEIAPQELQIRILKQAAGVLNAHAEEARENSARLRTLLLDGQLDANESETLKNQRWLEERRQLTAEQESKVLHDELELLSNGSLSATAPSPYSDAERRQANLVKFLATSTTRRPLQVRPPHKRRSHRFTVSDLATTRLQLPQSIIDYLKTRARVKSLGTQQRRSPGASPPGIRDSVAMTFGITGTESRSTSPSSSPTTSFGFSALPETAVTVPDVPTCSSDSAHSPQSSQDFDNLEGRATIYNRYSLIRRKDEILADMSHVTLPRYAKDLIHDFEDEPFNVSRSASRKSSWEILSAASSRKMDDLIPSPSPRTFIQVSGDAPSLPPMYRKGHKPLPSEPQSPTKSSVLQKRPTHRPVLSLVAIPETSSHREEDAGLRRGLSLGHRLRPTPSTLTEQDEEPVQAQPPKSLRRKLSIAGLFNTSQPSPSTDSIDSTAPVTVRRGFSLKDKLKKRFHL